MLSVYPVVKGGSPRLPTGAKMEPDGSPNTPSHRQSSRHSYQPARFEFMTPEEEQVIRASVASERPQKLSPEMGTAGQPRGTKRGRDPDEHDTLSPPQHSTTTYSALQDATSSPPSSAKRARFGTPSLLSSDDTNMSGVESMQVEVDVVTVVADASPWMGGGAPVAHGLERNTAKQPMSPRAIAAKREKERKKREKKILVPLVGEVPLDVALRKNPSLTQFRRRRPYERTETVWDYRSKGILDAPVFHPTLLEFADPVKYIESIRSQAEGFGICKIIPPKSWTPSFTLSWTDQLPTRLQRTYMLQRRGKSAVAAAPPRAFDVDQLPTNSADYTEESPLGERREPASDKTSEDLFKELEKQSRSEADPNSNERRKTRDRTRAPSRFDQLNKAEERLLNMVLRDSINDTKPVVPTRGRMMAMPGEFGFGDGTRYSLMEFRDAAREFKRQFFNMPYDQVQPGEVELEFWRIIETGEDFVQVEYGSDIDTLQYGSGFPRKGPYANHPWNLNAFPVAKGSVLQFLPNSITGVTSPWLYMGQMFGSFSWHTEDNYLYSINYLHVGDVKSWYGVPSSGADAFEALMKRTYADLFESNPDLLYQLVTLLSPASAAAAGVPVCHLEQRVGEFVITFPRAYHAGFSYGFNCAEAVNFATADWLPKGRESMEAYRHAQKKTSVFSFEHLLCSLQEARVTPEIFKWLEPELKLMVDNEQKERLAVNNMGLMPKEKVHLQPPQLSGDNMPSCLECRHIMFMSFIVCACGGVSKFTCLRHVDKMPCRCRGDAPERTFFYRHSWRQLQALHDAECGSAPVVSGPVRKDPPPAPAPAPAPVYTPTATPATAATTTAPLTASVQPSPMNLS